MKFYLLFLLLAMFACSNLGNDKQAQQHKYLRQVGDIPFDSKSDDANFKPCHEDIAGVHHNFNNPDLYEGEKPALVKEFKKLALPKIANSVGYVIIRFMVNCEGKTGRFRVEQLDMEYKPKQFNDELVKQLLTTTQSLQGWIPATHENIAFDYYKYLTFKIVDNQIVDILP